MQLRAQRHGGKQRVIYSTAEAGCHAEIRVRNAPALIGLVSHAQQKLSEWPVFAVSHRSARAKQERVTAGVQPKSVAAATKSTQPVVSPPAIVPVKIGYYSQPRQVFPSTDVSHPLMPAVPPLACTVRLLVKVSP